MNSGNSDAKSYNVGFDLKYDPKTKNVLKFGGLYLRSESNGATTADKLSAFVRDEYSFTDRFFVYGEVSYLQRQDRPPRLRSSRPTVGAGYKVVKTDADDPRPLGRLRRRVREVRRGRTRRRAAPTSPGEAFAWKISPTVSLTQKATGLWKSNDTGDAYYHFDVGLTTSLSKILELKLAYLLDHKTRPAVPTLEKTDTAFIAAVVAKF